LKSRSTNIPSVQAGEHGQVFGGGWCADYPDPTSGCAIPTGAGKCGYSNPPWIAAEEARVDGTWTNVAVYQHAEQLIVDEAPVIVKRTAWNTCWSSPTSKAIR
jgi:hypothetical protein